MFEFLIRSIDILLPIFIFCIMANVGMTQDPRRVVRNWRDWRFLATMTAANFIAAPAIMVLLVLVWPMPDTYKAALFVYSLCAGAPFLIKLAQSSRSDITLAVTTMVLLVVGTIIYVPLVLPFLLPDASVVDRGAMEWLLIRQLLFPMVGGALVAYFLPKLNQLIQPWIARIGNYTLYALLFAAIVGYLPDIPPIMESGALLAGVLFVLLSFGLGYAVGGGDARLSEIGGLATAQRNTAAAMVIATSSFEDPMVFVLIAMANTLGIVILLLLASEMKRRTVLSRMQPILSVWRL